MYEVCSHYAVQMATSKSHDDSSEQRFFTWGPWIEFKNFVGLDWKEDIPDFPQISNEIWHFYMNIGN